VGGRTLVAELQGGLFVMRRFALPVVLVISIAGACGGSGSSTSVANCRNGRRLVDAAVYLDPELGAPAQADFAAMHFNAGDESVGSLSDYSTYSPSSDVVYLYADAPLPRSTRASVRRWAERFSEVDHVDFDVQLPADEGGPIGEC
jgi:hypothetical protein